MQDARHWSNVLADVGNVAKREGHAVPHQDSVLHALLQQVPWAEFERLCAVHGADQDARGYSAKG
jgi:hypothetical protein